MIGQLGNKGETKSLWYSFKLKTCDFPKIFHGPVFNSQKDTQSSIFQQDIKICYFSNYFGHNTSISSTSATLTLLTSSYSTVSSVTSVSSLRSLSSVGSLSTVSLVWSAIYAPSSLIRSPLNFDHFWSDLHPGPISVWPGPINFWSDLRSSMITPADQAPDQSESSLVFFWTFLCNLIGRGRTIVLPLQFTPKVILIDH